MPNKREASIWANPGLLASVTMMAVDVIIGIYHADPTVTIDTEHVSLSLLYGFLEHIEHAPKEIQRN